MRKRRDLTKEAIEPIRWMMYSLREDLNSREMNKYYRWTKAKLAMNSCDWFEVHRNLSQRMDTNSRISTNQFVAENHNHSKLISIQAVLPTNS